MIRGRDYIGVGVGAVIVNERGQVFMAKRGPKSRNERGLWEFPGGAVEFGEKLADALMREMFEEFGIRIEVGDLIDVCDHILPEEGQHWVSPSYICRIVAGVPAIHEHEKCSEIGWFDLASIPADLTLISKESLEHYRQKIKR